MNAPYDRAIHLRREVTHSHTTGSRVRLLRARVDNLKALIPTDRNLFYLDRDCGHIERDYTNGCSLSRLLQDLTRAEAAALALEIARAG